jgi:hypothetical protein
MLTETAGLGVGAVFAQHSHIRTVFAQHNYVGVARAPLPQAVALIDLIEGHTHPQLNPGTRP